MIDSLRVSEAYSDALEVMGLCGLVRHRLDELKDEGGLSVDDCAAALSVAWKILDRVTDVLGEIERYGVLAATLRRVEGA